MFLLALLILVMLVLLWAIVSSSLWYCVYEPRKLKPILNQYSGNRSMQILRALSDGKIKPNDIRHYFNTGVSGTMSWSLEEFRLINQFADKGNCEIKTYHSGHITSRLYEVSLDIKHGKAIVIKTWHAA